MSDIPIHGPSSTGNLCDFDVIISVSAAADVLSEPFKYSIARIIPSRQDDNVNIEFIARYDKDLNIHA